MKKKKANAQDRLTMANSKNVPLHDLNFELHANNRNNSFIQLSDILTSFTDLDLYDRLVYCALRNYAENDLMKQKKTTVTNETVAIRLGISQSRVSQSISHLQELGCITINRDKTEYKRIIQIQKDFREKQPEQIKAEEQEEYDLIDF